MYGWSVGSLKDGVCVGGHGSNSCIQLTCRAYLLSSSPCLVSLTPTGVDRARFYCLNLLLRKRVWWPYRCMHAAERVPSCPHGWASFHGARQCAVWRDAHLHVGCCFRSPPGLLIDDSPMWRVLLSLFFSAPFIGAAAATVPGRCCAAFHSRARALRGSGDRRECSTTHLRARSSNGSLQAPTPPALTCFSHPTLTDALNAAAAAAANATINLKAPGRRPVFLIFRMVSLQFQ